MPAFRYEAVDAGGATKKGVLNSDSARSARAELRTQGLVPLKVDAMGIDAVVGMAIYTRTLSLPPPSKRT